MACFRKGSGMVYSEISESNSRGDFSLIGIRFLFFVDAFGKSI